MINNQSNDFKFKQDKYALLKSTEILFNKKTEDRINVKVPYAELQKQVRDFAEIVVQNKENIISTVFTSDTVDEYTIGHSINVCMLSILIGDLIGYTGERLGELAMSALLHDIGKRKTPREILFKKNALTDEEFRVMKKHSQDGWDFMERVYPEASLAVKRGILEHHERMNYTGYPKQIGWYEISDFARIIAVADVYEGFTALRAYHDKRTIAEGVNCIRNTAGLDKNIVDLFTCNTVFYPQGLYVVLSDQSVAVVSKTETGDMPEIVAPGDKTPLEVGDRCIIDVLPPTIATYQQSG